MVSPLRGAWRLTLRSYCEIPGTVKLLVPPQQSWGGSHVGLGEPYTSGLETTSRNLPADKAPGLSHERNNNQGQTDISIQRPKADLLNRSLTPISVTPISDPYF